MKEKQENDNLEFSVTSCIAGRGDRGGQGTAFRGTADDALLLKLGGRFLF